MKFKVDFTKSGGVVEVIRESDKAKAEREHKEVQEVKNKKHT